MKFCSGDPDPKIWGCGRLALGALAGDPKAASNAVRMVALSAAVTEILAIEHKNLEPSSGGTGCARGLSSRM